MNQDIFYMRRACRLAERALGRTTPNPIVGAVIVGRHGILGEGFHTKAGNPHAEVEAIRSAEGKNLAGSTLYVTLEPCSTWGRTPPCTKAILENGISRVVIGCTDPNPRHAGAAAGILREHGVEVECGVEETRCRRMNEAFFKWITVKKPFVILKLAMTLDGRIATESGNSQWITGPTARKRVQKLRQWADAVMVGGETFRKDSPRLTVRDAEGRDIKVPKRFIATSRLAECPENWTCVSLKTTREWDDFLLKLGEMPVMSLLLEGGGTLAASALNAGAVDKIEFHYAPKILGGAGSRPAVGGYDPLTLAEAFGIQDMKITRLGPDFAVTGYVRRNSERRV